MTKVCRKSTIYILLFRLVGERTIKSIKQFVQCKQYQCDISAGQLKNMDHIRLKISEYQIYVSFKNVRGKPRYYQNMMSDVLTKISMVPIWYGTLP